MYEINVFCEDISINSTNLYYNFHFLKFLIINNKKNRKYAVKNCKNGYKVDKIIKN